LYSNEEASVLKPPKNLKSNPKFEWAQKEFIQELFRSKHAPKAIKSNEYCFASAK
jgi:hypothetical protein